MFSGNLSELVLAAGALGVAAYGLVEAFKWAWIGLIGFGKVEAEVGSPFAAQLMTAYGNEYPALLAAQYRNGRSKGELAKTLRQGIRIGLTKDNAPAAALALGGTLVTATALAQAAAAVASSADGALPPEHRATLGRFELAIDARIESALGLAESVYVGGARLHAMGAALLLAIVAAASIETATNASAWLFGMSAERWVTALVVGIVAVPLAPVANDLAGALQAVTKALRQKSA